MTMRFFSIMSTDLDAAPALAPHATITGSFNGAYFGVLKTDNPDLITILEGWKKRELTEAQYEAEVKKKAAQLQSSEHFRPVAPSVVHGVRRAETVIDPRPPSPPPAPAKPAIRVDDVVKPTPVPRRKSQML